MASIMAFRAINGPHRALRRTDSASERSGKHGAFSQQANNLFGTSKRYYFTPQPLRKS
jgi:hypothetical protein